MYERVGLKGDNKVHRGPRAGRRFNVPSGGDERYTGTGVPGGRAVTGWLDTRTPPSLPRVRTL